MKNSRNLSSLVRLLILSLSLLIDKIHAQALGYSANASPTVDLEYASYQGTQVVDEVSNVTNTNFLGMRYAAAPTGALRFAAPQAPSATPGIQAANSEPNLCFAAPEGSQPITPFRVGSVLKEKRSDAPGFDEDCLFLNVYVPGNFTQKKGLPVVVWIHGGGYVLGSASGLFGTDNVYDGNNLLRDAGGEVVAVVIQYRLGLFGFLAGQNVKDGGALNAGLLDQQFALRWVQTHIEKFGGDPAKVTIWGQSAGAGSVLQHVIANGGQTSPPLFRGAMTSSTFLPSQYKFNDRIPETLYSEVVARTNCSSAVDTLACLRVANIDTLQAANTNITNNSFFGTFSFAPVVDGTFITDRPTRLLKERKINGKMLYSVTNTFEGSIFVNESAVNSIPQYIAQLFPTLGPKEIAAATKQYAALGSNSSQAVAIMGESILICPTYYLMRAFDGVGYKGEFAVPPGSHGDDIAYYFPATLAQGDVPTFENAAFEKSFSESFLNFVRTLNPGIKFDKANITPLWHTWNGANEMLFNRTEAGAPDIRQIKTSSDLLERCEFWESVGDLSAQ